MNGKQRPVMAESKKEGGFKRYLSTCLKQWSIARRGASLVFFMYRKAGPDKEYVSMGCESLGVGKILGES